MDWPERGGGPLDQNSLLVPGLSSVAIWTLKGIKSYSGLQILIAFGQRIYSEFLLYTFTTVIRI